MSPSKFDLMATLPLRSGDRRVYWRFHLPVSVLVEATWRGQPLALATDPDYENISAVGASLALAQGSRPPVGEEVRTGCRWLRRRRDGPSGAVSRRGCGPIAAGGWYGTTES